VAVNRRVVDAVVLTSHGVHDFLDGVGAEAGELTGELPRVGHRSARVEKRQHDGAGGEYRTGPDKLPRKGPFDHMQSCNPLWVDWHPATVMVAGGATGAPPRRQHYCRSKYLRSGLRVNSEGTSAGYFSTSQNGR